MDKETPGSPPDSEKPKEPTNIAFSYKDLELINVEIIDNQRYLVFLVNMEYLISIIEWEYFSYLSFIFQQTTILRINNENACNCDMCTPEAELLEKDVPLHTTKIDLDNETKEHKETSIKFYSVFNLIPNTIVGVCDTHNFDINDINL